MGAASGCLGEAVDDFDLPPFVPLAEESVFFDEPDEDAFFASRAGGAGAGTESLLVAPAGAAAVCAKRGAASAHPAMKPAIERALFMILSGSVVVGAANMPGLPQPPGRSNGSSWARRVPTLPCGNTG